MAKTAQSKTDETISFGGGTQAGTRRDPNDESQICIDLAAAYQLIALNGMDDSIFTHISARLPDGPDGTKRFLLNPYGLMFDEVTASNLVTIDETGAIIDDPYGAGVNAAGFTIHSAVHMARHDAACVLHTHTVKRGNQFAERGAVAVEPMVGAVPRENRIP